MRQYPLEGNRVLSSPIPQTPTAPSGSTEQVSNAISSIIQTGSAQPKLATLVNPNTGERKAVAVGSQEAQALFGQGFILETAAPGAGGAPGGAGAPGGDVG